MNINRRHSIVIYIDMISMSLLLSTRRELDTPTPDEEHKAWIKHVMDTVAPRIISRLQKSSKPNVQIDEPVIYISIVFN